MILAQILTNNFYLSNTNYTFKNYLHKASFLASLRINKIKLPEELEKQ